MAVHRAILHDLSPSVGGAIVRDSRTGDWLVVMSLRNSAEDRCAIFNQLMAQLEGWDERGHSTAEVRKYLCGIAVD